MASVIRYAARWATSQERVANDGANAVVEDVSFPPIKVLCFVSPMALAERMACALNFAERFDLAELKRMSVALGYSSSPENK